MIEAVWRLDQLEKEVKEATKGGGHYTCLPYVILNLTQTIRHLWKERERLIKMVEEKALAHSPNSEFEARVFSDMLYELAGEMRQSNKKRDMVTHCRVCGTKLVDRPKSFHWRGRYFKGLVCPKDIQHGLWQHPDEPDIYEYAAKHSSDKKGHECPSCKSSNVVSGKSIVAGETEHTCMDCLYFFKPTADKRCDVADEICPHCGRKWRDH